LTEVDYAWLAGIVDGEGYVGFMSDGKGRKPVAVIEVKMTCKATIERCMEISGTGHFRGGRYPSASCRLQQFTWRCKGGDAKAVARCLLEYAVTKKSKLAELAE